MRRSYYVGLCLATCLTSPAAAERWYTLGTSDTTIDFADADSVRTYGDIISVDVFRGIDNASGSGFLKLAVDLSCANNQLRVTRAVTFDVARKYLETDEEVTEWATIAPDSMAELVRQFACDGSLRGSPVSDPFAAAEAYWYYYYDY